MKHELRGKTVVVIATGSNITPEAFGRLHG
jgi:hypothetical protein